MIDCRIHPDQRVHPSNVPKILQELTNRRFSANLRKRAKEFPLWNFITTFYQRVKCETESSPRRHLAPSYSLRPWTKKNFFPVNREFISRQRESENPNQRCIKKSLQIKYPACTIALRVFVVLKTLSRFFKS